MVKLCSRPCDVHNPLWEWRTYPSIFWDFYEEMASSQLKKLPCPRLCCLPGQPTSKDDQKGVTEIPSSQLAQLWRAIWALACPTSLWLLSLSAQSCFVSLHPQVSILRASLIDGMLGKSLFQEIKVSYQFLSLFQAASCMSLCKKMLIIFILDQSKSSPRIIISICLFGIV